METSIGKIFEEEIPPVPLPGIDDDPKDSPAKENAKEKWGDVASKTLMNGGRKTIFYVYSNGAFQLSKHNNASIKYETK